MLFSGLLSVLSTVRLWIVQQNIHRLITPRTRIKQHSNTPLHNKIRNNNIRKTKSATITSQQQLNFIHRLSSFNIISTSSLRTLSLVVCCRHSSLSHFSLTHIPQQHVEHHTLQRASHITACKQQNGATFNHTTLNTVQQQHKIWLYAVLLSVLCVLFQKQVGDKFYPVHPA